MITKIPVYQPELGDSETEAVLDCLRTNWISSKGEYITKFERGFSDFIGTDHCTACCNGTVALHLALLALGIGPDDEVIVPTLTYIASVNAIRYVGAKPVFVDCEPSTWQISIADTERRITDKTKAILAVHLYGQASDVEALRSICDKEGLFLVEDCAEAIGSRVGERHVGTFGDIATFSFFGNKTITTGEGGMVATDDKTLDHRLRRFRGQGLAEHREYWHDIIGYNYRMTNICAAIGTAQLAKVDSFISRKRELATSYRNALAGLPIMLHSEAIGTTHSYWMVSILCEKANDRDPLRNYLGKFEIETRPVFYPVHTMPMYSSEYQRHPVSEDIAWRGINLPSWPGLSREQVRFISDKIHEYYQSRPQD